jgi:hypothetical protein
MFGLAPVLFTFSLVTMLACGSNSGRGVDLGEGDSSQPTVDAPTNTDLEGGAQDAADASLTDADAGTPSSVSLLDAATADCAPWVPDSGVPYPRCLVSGATYVIPATYTASTINVSCSGTPCSCTKEVTSPSDQSVTVTVVESTDSGWEVRYSFPNVAPYSTSSGDAGGATALYATTCGFRGSLEDNSASWCVGAVVARNSFRRDSGGERSGSSAPIRG